MTTAPAPAFVGRQLTYTLSLTNLTGGVLSIVDVTNRLPASAAVVSANSTNVTATVTTNVGGGIRFRIDSFASGAPATLTVGIVPSLAGRLTNAVGVGVNLISVKTTNVVNTVYSSQANLGVSLSGPPTPLYLGDWATYGLIVTNAGPEAAAGIVLTNSLPAGWEVQGVAPSSAGTSFTNGSLRIEVGTMAPSNSLRYDVTARALTVGAGDLGISVSAPDLYDTNSANNSVSNPVVVVSPISGLLSVSLISTQWFNPQTGFIEQIARLTNTGEVRVASARVVVAGLTNRLANAVGTNDTGPFVVVGRALDPGQSVDLVLEYFAPSRLPGPDPTLSAFGILRVTSEVPAGTSVRVSRIVLVTPGRVMLEFPASTGRFYTVVCADSVSFTNTWSSRPAVEAQASRAQWIDYGLPRTLGAVTNSPARFYRVVEVQP